MKVSHRAIGNDLSLECALKAMAWLIVKVAAARKAFATCELQDFVAESFYTYTDEKVVSKTDHDIVVVTKPPQ